MAPGTPLRAACPPARGGITLDALARAEEASHLARGSAGFGLIAASRAGVPRQSGGSVAVQLVGDDVQVEIRDTGTELHLCLVSALGEAVAMLTPQQALAIATDLTEMALEIGGHPSSIL